MGLLNDIVTDFQRTIKVRKNLKDEDSYRTLAINESRGYRLPAIYSNNFFFLTDKAAWTAGLVPAKQWRFLDTDAKENSFRNAVAFYQNSFPAEKGNQGHILSSNRVFSPNDWADAVIANNSERAGDVFEGYIRQTKDNIDGKEFFERDVYLFTRLDTRKRVEGIRGWFQKQFDQYILGQAGLEDTQPDDAEIEKWTEVSDSIDTALWNSPLQVQMIGQARLEWITRHIDSLSLPTPEISTPDAYALGGADKIEWGLGQWKNVLSSEVRNIDLGRGVGRYRYSGVEFTNSVGEGKAYAAFLPISQIPDEVGYQTNWMHHSADLDFPVDISCHFEIIDTDRAERMIQKQADRAITQQQEDQEAGVASDDETLQQEYQARQARMKIKSARESIAIWQAVFCVYDTSIEGLREKIQKLRSHYEPLQFRLENPPKVQRDLWYQFFPGSEIEVEEWIHRTSPQYIAAAQPWLSSHVGDSDGTGLYQGYTLKVSPQGQTLKGSPVFFDLLNVADVKDVAPTEAVCAESGSGKTVSRGLKCVFEDSLRGITQIVWDPKDDFRSLYMHGHRIGLDKNKIRLVDVMSSRNSISLDPMGSAEVDYSDPEFPVDEREALTIDILRQMLSTFRNDDKANKSDYLLSLVVRQELAKNGGRYVDYSQLPEDQAAVPLEEEPCLAGVLKTLEKWGTKDERIPAINDAEQDDYAGLARMIFTNLDRYANSKVGRLIFRRPSESRSLNIERGDLLIFIASGLNTTEAGAEQTDKTLLPDIVAGLITDFIRSLLNKLPAYYEKAATFDEWHVIKKAGRAGALVEWLRRVGRSKRCMVRQLSQSPYDFLDSKVALNAIWCGRVNSNTEAEGSCELLGIEPSDYNIKTLRSLQKGQFLFRDADMRIAPVQVDIWEPTVREVFNTKAKDQEAKTASA